MEHTLATEIDQYGRCFSRLAYARSMFLRRAHVCGVGVGPKQVRDNLYPNQPCLIVYVSEKKQTLEIDHRDHIPPVFRGVVTDVVAVGSRVIPAHNEFDQRWLRCGEESPATKLG